LFDTDALHGAIAEDGEGEDSAGGARRADARIDTVLQPVFFDAFADAVHVPGIPSREIAATRALNGDAAAEWTWVDTAAGRQAHLSAATIGNGVVLRGSFVFENFGLIAGSELFFLLEFLDVGGVGFWLGLFGLGLFLV